MTSGLAFGARLVEAMDKRGPLCVGIDPHPDLLRAWSLPVSALGLERFCETCVGAFGDVGAVIKPQSAFFEVFGSAGLAVLERTISAARAAGGLVLLDVKRGDIGSTMSAYAQGYLDPAAPLAADAITVSPYLGVESLAPAFEAAVQHGNGVFVLAVTSNPGGGQVQRAQTPDGKSVAQAVVDELAARNSRLSPLGSLGVVFGATASERGVDLTQLNGPILAPGVGAQGGTPEDVRRLFGNASAVLPSVSRSVLRQGPDVEALRAAVARQIEQFAFLRG
jgi:orotidine-5'-phosphate decarboxylase